MTLLRRKIDMTFKLVEGAFDKSGSNEVKVSGLRTSVTVERGGGLFGATMNLRVYGLPADIYNQLITLGTLVYRTKKNLVEVSAGDDKSGMASVFTGTILFAWLQVEQPDACLVVTAQTLAEERLRPIDPTSFTDAVDAAVVLSGLANQAGLRFENSGVSVMLSHPYFEGTAMTQIDSCARQADIGYVIQDDVLAIFPKEGSRGGAVPLISAETGLIGYPGITQNGLALTTVFIRGVNICGRVEVNSDLSQANGFWPVYAVTHNLEAETPSGQWSTHLECYINGQPQPTS